MEITWNKYPKITNLKQGQKVAYELVNVRKDALDPERKRLAIPVIKEIPIRDRVLINDEYVDIAYITGYTQGGKPVFGRIRFGNEEDIEASGKLIIRGGSARAQAQYEYMEQTNYNESNPNRNPAVQPIFRKVDYKERLKEKRTEREYLKEALNISSDMTASMVAQIAIALNYRDEDPNQLRGRIEEFAMINPKKFIALTENKDLNIMEIYEQAKKKGLVKSDIQTRKIMSQSGEMLTTWSPEPNVNDAEKFVLFVKSDEGSKFYDELKIQLKSKKGG